MKTEDIKQLAAAWAEVQEKAAKERQEQAEAMLAQEGKLPPALQAYMDKKKGKKSDDKEDDDGEDKKSDAKPDFLDLDKDGDKKEPMKKAAADKKMKKESTEVNELSKKTLGSYIKRASSDNAVNNMAKGIAMATPNSDSKDSKKMGMDVGSLSKLSRKRKAGISTAVDKMTKEDLDLEEKAKVGSDDATRDTYEKQLKTRKGEKDFVDAHKSEVGADAKKANDLNFATFKTMVKKSPMRSNDNASGDKSAPKGK